MGKMMEQGPVLIITFQAQMVLVVRNVRGDVVEGDPVCILHPGHLADAFIQSPLQ